MAKRKKKRGDGQYHLRVDGMYSALYIDEHGKRKMRNTGETTLTEARKVRRRWLADRDQKKRHQNVRAAAQCPEPADLTYDAMVGYYAERRALHTGREFYRGFKPKHLHAFFGGRKWSAIRRPDLEAYVDHRRAMGVAWSTVKNELAMLQAAQNVAVDGERLDPRFVTSFRKLIPKFDNARELVWSPEECDAMEAALPEPYDRVFRYGRLTGWRHRSEVLALNYVEHVDLDAKVIRLTAAMTKESYPRVLPFGYLPTLEALIAQQVEWTRACGYDPLDPGQAFFHYSREHRRYPGRRIGSWRTVWRQAMAEAVEAAEGFKTELRYHDLRHTAVTRLQDAGVRPKVITQLTGHRTIAMQQRYDNPTAAQMEAALGKVQDALRAETVKIA